MLGVKLTIDKRLAIKPPVPLWKGPEEDGVTFSMLGKFLGCKERFRIQVIEGLRPEPRFTPVIEYGQMWHVCEEALAAKRPWLDDLREYGSKLITTYRGQSKEVDKWYRACKAQFPIYIEYWKKHPDVRNRVPIYQEKTFDVAYRLPSGRVVRLRGKWDSVDFIKGEGVYLQENKTKSDIDRLKIGRQLTFDLQTMLYITAMYNSGYQELKGKAIKGVRYNVIKRPLSGGKGSIKQRKPTKKNPQGESLDAYYQRLQDKFKENPRDFFDRWKVLVTKQDVDRFRTTCLDPLLENLCRWYEYVGHGNQEYSWLHWRHPFGLRNIIDEGGSTDLDDHLLTGSKVGLVRVDRLFTELEP